MGGGGQTGGSDDTTSPRLKKKRLISNTFNTNVTSLEITSDMPKAESETTAAPSSGSEMYQQNQTGSSNPTGNTAAAPSVSDLSKQLINEQELRRSLENRLKSLEMQAASVASNTATTTTVRNFLLYFCFVLMVSKYQKHFFLKLHCPKNERNIRQDSAL